MAARYISSVINESCFLMRLPKRLRIGEDDFFELFAVNRELWLERTVEGDIVVMPPAGGETGAANAEITAQLRTWAKRDRTGRTFASDTGFTLPNGAMRAPDAAWVLKIRWNKLPKEDRERFAHICPDFVVELKSPFPSVPFLQAKMQYSIEN